MKHQDARIEALLSAIPHPRLAAIDLSLDRVEALLFALGNPHLQLPPVVHVAGTNGKGSLLAYLTSILQAAGYHVHRYASPHLIRFNERILLAGREIDDHTLLDNLERVNEHVGVIPVTRFEAETAAAFLAFHETEADILLLETGLGGRLDATNVIPAPLLTAITPVSMDHMDYLGNSLKQIAGEKAGILKKSTPCVVGPQVPEVLAIIEERAATLHAPLFRYGREWNAECLPGPVALPGEHQKRNAATAIACAAQLNGFTITEEHIVQGLAHAKWPARLQHLASGALAALLPADFELWLDGGHNAGAGEVLGAWAATLKKPLHLIVGMLKSKDAEAFLAPLAPHAKSLTAIPIASEPQTQDPQAIFVTGKKLNLPSRVENEIVNAIEHIVTTNRNPGIILICGSLYLAGNALWQNGKNPLQEHTSR